MDFAMGLVGSIVIGFVVGLVFSFAAADSWPRRRKTVLIGLSSAMVGWIFGMALPLIQYKTFGVIGLSAITALDGSYIFWAVIRERSKLARDIDANAPANPRRNVERPTAA